MKLETKEASVVSNVPSDDVTKMSISAEGVSHIMSSLTNLYNDPMLAVVREYYSNAIDSHIEAGQTAPVEITLPSRSAPSYIVQDYGIGMSEDDIRNIYAQYGASTKRNTNDAIGAFGLGCKSALAITNQFTLISVKNGRKITVHIARTEEGTNDVSIINKLDTDESNGVRVVIPVGDVYSFTNTAQDFFSYVNPDTVLVNGRHPESELDKAKKIETDHDDFGIYMAENGRLYSGTSQIIMGGIPYQLDRTAINESFSRLGISVPYGLQRTHVYFTVEIGAVDLSPSREGIRFTAKTKELLDQMVSVYYETIKVTAQKEIDAEDDRGVVPSLISQWSNKLGVSLQWRGEDVPQRIEYKPAKDSEKFFHTVDRDGDYAAHNTEYYISVGKSYIFVSGLKNSEYKKASRYLGPFLSARNQFSGYFAFIEDTSIITDPWITESSKNSFITADELIEEAKEYNRKVRAENKASPKPKVKIRYPVLDIKRGDVEWVDYDQIPAGTPYLDKSNLMHGSQVKEVINQRFTYEGGLKRFDLLKDTLPYFTDATHLVLVTGSRTSSALEKRVKNTYSLHKDIERKKKEVDKLVTEEIKETLSIESQNTYDSIKRFLKTSQKLPEIEDKMVRNIVQQNRVPGMEKVKEYHNYVRAIPYTNLSDFLLDMTPAKEVPNLSTRFPLISNLAFYRNVPVDHVIAYINAVYNLQK